MILKIHILGIRVLAWPVGIALNNLFVLFANFFACPAAWHDEVQMSDDDCYGDVDFDLDTQEPYA